MGDERANRGTPGPGPLPPAVCSTRAYDDGLGVGFRLLAATERYRRRMTAKAYEEKLITLYLFILNMLDKADGWEEYLAAWQSIRENTTLSLSYSFDALESHGEKIRPFVLSGLPERRKAIGDGGSTALAHTDGVQELTHDPPQPQDIQVHFLYLQKHRRELVERKLARQRAGKLVRSMMHGRREDLTRAEIRDRLAWIREMARQRRERT